MLDDIGGVTSQMVKVALDASVLKHKVIANNIANANTDGFKPLTTSFENLLLNIEHDRFSPIDDELVRSQLNELSRAIDSGEVIEQSSTSKVELDVEMAKLTENVIRYRALLEGLSKRGSIIKMAVSQQGGK
ncbi:MAG: flagellar basal body rod protein FlgB [Gammaproteobacteria bacterium]|jgi:flagellar basal-body rod protein FlgB